MPSNGKVFISHAHEDNDRCGPLLSSLTTWGIDYWFDLERIHAGDSFTHRIEREIEGRDIFIRICTPAAQRSYWVSLEHDAFRSLLADDWNQGFSDKRTVINLVMDSGYFMEPFVRARLYIDACGKPLSNWIEELRRALVNAGAIKGVMGPVSSGPSSSELEQTQGDQQAALGIGRGRQTSDQPTNGSLVVSGPSAQGSIRTLVSDPRIIKFVDDDTGYRAWVAAHPRGYVLNCERSPRPNYLMLHYANCGWIQRPIKRGDHLTAAFIKFCSLDRSALAGWAQNEVGGPIQPCGLCKP